MTQGVAPESLIYIALTLIWGKCFSIKENTYE